jgi:glyoxylase-like metal-dependent hydrolase (beta-lactamase superfamily II)
MPNTPSNWSAMLNGKSLTRLVNAHSHPDHIGGNAASEAAFGCRFVFLAGLHAAIAEWDEGGMLLAG